MKLIAYRIADSAPAIRTSARTREWMDQTGDRFAYRCLPLVIANTHGWEVLCPFTIEAYWNGSNLKDGIEIRADQPYGSLVTSHFGNGILTFHTGYIFQTDPEYSLHVSGPANWPKDGVHALTGIVETDWLPFPFTMNWRFTAAGGPVIFEKGEPFCQIYPVPRRLLEEVEPEVRLLSSNPELAQQHDEWTRSRTQFNADLEQENPRAKAEGWQKNYTRGRTVDGTPASAPHLTKLQVKEFVELARDKDSD